MKRLLTLTPVVVTAALLVPAATGSSAASAPYEPGDVLIVDADTPPVSNAVLFNVDPESGARTVLHNFGGSSPNAVAVESDGSILVTDTAAGTDPSGGTNEWGVLYRLRPDPATGQLTRTILSDFGDGVNTGRFPRAVAVEADGQILVLNGSGGTTVVVERPVLVRIDPNTGARSLVSDFGNRSQNGHPSDPPTCTTSCLGVEPRGVAVEADGQILVIDAQAGQGTTGNGQGLLFRVDPETGVRTRLSNFGVGANQGSNPTSVAVEASGQILVTDEGHTSTTPLGLLFRIDPHTGARTILSDFNTGANPGREPAGVAIEANGQILVADKDAGPFNWGMVFRIDPQTGHRAIVSDFGVGANRGGEPEAIAIVPPSQATPVAVDDAYAVDEDSSLNVAAPGVLGNDTDANQDTLTAVLDSGPTNAAGFVLNADGSFAYSPNANFNGTDTFTYHASDGTTSSGQATVTITVNAVDDPAIAVDDSATVTEDSGPNAIDVLANDTDPDGGAKTIASASDADHGTVVVTGGGTGLTYQPDANYCNGGSPTDDVTYTLNGGSTATLLVTVSCVDDPPVVAFTGGPPARDEGQSGTYTFSVTDPDSSSFTFEAGYPTCGVGGTPLGTPTLDSSDGSFVCSYPDGPASPTVAVTVRDATSSSNEATLPVAVVNLPPTIVTFTAASPVDEGGSSTVAVTASDPAGANDPLSYEFDCDGNGTFEVGPGAGASHSCAYPDDGTFTVAVRVTDGDGGADTDVETVQVRNLAPTVTPPAGQTASEGTQSFALGSFTDPGDDPWQVAIDWGDGSADTVFVEASPDAIAAQPHRYADDGNFTVTVTVTEDDGAGASGSATFQVAVANVPPAVTAPTDQTANEGASHTFDLGSFTDPGDDDPWQVTVDWGDGSEDSVFGEAAEGAITGQAHTYAADGLYTVTITVDEQDGAGASGSATFQATIANVASNLPTTVTITSPSSSGPVPAGSPVVAKFTDPDENDTHTCRINGGTATVTEVVGSGTGTCSNGTVPPGSTTITVEVCDDHGGCGTDSLTTRGLYAIYANERCAGGSGKGIIVNGDDADVDGLIHSNGNLTLNGANFNSGTLSLYRPQSGCSAVYDRSRVNFGPPSPTAPVDDVEQPWPWYPAASEFPCTAPVKDEYIFNTAGQTIAPGVYCARKTFKINANNITGNITVLAPEIVINGRNINLSAHTKGMLLFNVYPDTGALSSKEIVVDSDFTPDTTATLTGLLHNPGGGVKINGQAVRMNRGFIQGRWVEINLKGFRMTY